MALGMTDDTPTGLTSGRLLGLDVGDRRVGVAISDPERRLAVPLHSVERDGRRLELDVLATLARQEDVTALVVGLPLTLSGEAGSQAERTRAFARDLERHIGLPVHLWDERLSTQEAQRLVAEGGRRERGRRGRGRTSSADLDALAASIILQSYLDSLRANGA